MRQINMYQVSSSHRAGGRCSVPGMVPGRFRGPESRMHPRDRRCRCATREGKRLPYPEPRAPADVWGGEPPRWARHKPRGNDSMRAPWPPEETPSSVRPRAYANVMPTAHVAGRPRAEHKSQVRGRDPFTLRSPKVPRLAQGRLPPRGTRTPAPLADITGFRMSRVCYSYAAPVCAIRASSRSAGNNPGL